LIKFFVPGKAIPKQSYRAVKGGGYTDPKVKAWQETISWNARDAVHMQEWYTGDLEVSLLFVLPDNRRKDLDNLSKAVLDGMNGIVYADDKQITRLVLEKQVGGEPGVLIEVTKRPPDGIV
jgi:Holliday junction resolvase RusA-like endonuclease